MANDATAMLDDSPLNPFHRLLTMRSGGGSLVDGYALSVIGVGMIPISAALGLNHVWEGIIAASSLVGIFVGGLVGGWLTDRLGRRRIFFVGPILFIVFSLAAFWIDSAVTLFISRFMIGVGVGIEYPVATALLVEFLPRRHRGPRLSLLTILWFVGAALAYLVGNIALTQGGVDGWRYALASTAIIGAALLLIRLGTPESPRWLLSKGRRSDADAIIKHVYGTAFDSSNLGEEPAQSNKNVSALLRAGYGPRLAFVLLFWTCSVMPVFAVYSFAPKVLKALHVHDDQAVFGSVAITTMFVIGCIFATMIINRLGRRKSIINSFLWSGIALLGLGAASESSPIIILLLFGAYAFFIGGAQVLQLVYPNELFPTDIRAAVVGMGTSLSRIGAAIGTFLVPISLSIIGIGYTMYAAAAVGRHRSNFKCFSRSRDWIHDTRASGIS